MNFKYALPENWIKKIAHFSEFADGATQVSIRTRDGKIFSQILISTCTYIVAMRNYDDLPFSINDIEDIVQTEEDLHPKKNGGWKFWDDWQVPQGKFKPRQKGPLKSRKL